MSLITLKEMLHKGVLWGTFFISGLLFSTKFDLFCKISTGFEHVYSEGFYKECVKGTMKS